MRQRTGLAWIAALGVIAACMGAPPRAEAAGKKIVFLAGRASHGYGSHEHLAGCTLLAKCLQQGMPDYEVHVVPNGWPDDETILEGADCIVMYADGGGGHPVIPKLERMEQLTAKGVGLVCLHYAVEVPKGEPGDRFVKWIGGYFETHWSVNPHWVARFEQLPSHPICRGVKPFETDDEWYYHMRFREEMRGVTPILTAVPPASTLDRPDGPHSGNPAVRAEIGKSQHVAWASERPDGGRGFGFTGGHYHWNWGDPDFRRLVLNAIVWTAHGDVPDGGVSERPVTLRDLEAGQDEPPGNTDREAIRKKFRLPADGAAVDASRPRRVAVKPLFQSNVVTTETAGHGVPVAVELNGATQLFLVVRDGGNGFGCDWADWGEPRLVGGNGAMRLTDLQWKSATSQWGQVRIDRNADGGPLRVAGKPIPFGIGTHANSKIAFDIPEGYDRFEAFAGLDNGGSDQAGGSASSVQFQVYADDPGPVEDSSAGGGSREPADAVAGLDVADGLEATLFASEPDLLSLTNLDIDHRGRIWVCEVVNYRRHLGERPEGDRILILEDGDGDGKADSTKVYYQGRDVDSAMGLCVLGNRVIVSASPNVLVFTDEDGDDRPDRKEVLFANTGQPQHDHSAHSFLFGPDGRLYWNFGNTGQRVCGPDGRPIIDRAGREVVDNGKPYFGGMVFRCEPDASRFEVLAHNFRNNYEVAVDSFGGLWQSDNDDDGNRGVRINHIVEFGNYGYRDERTGAGWQTPRTNQEEEIPLRHWHLNDPGVVPNLLQTGGGSPTGITVYEGRLLPERFHDQVIHCDAGPNVVRAYPVERDGAGYRAESVSIVKGTRDNWFRPADVCVAPDGSLFVTDWYDPGVGGHNMVDMGRGRLFRIAPPGEPYRVAPIDLSTVNGAIEALRSPNGATRYLAFTALRGAGGAAESALGAMAVADPNPRFRARAIWLLGMLPERAERTAREALADPCAELRILGLRLARRFDIPTPPIVLEQVARGEKDPHVLRECAVALAGQDDPRVPEAWAALAVRYPVSDRWYLEALGIAAEGRWDACMDRYWREVGDREWTRADMDIVWRSRATNTAEWLAKLIRLGEDRAGPLPRYFRAFDFQAGPCVSEHLLRLAFETDRAVPGADGIIDESLARLQPGDVAQKPGARDTLVGLLRDRPRDGRFVEIVDRFELEPYFGELVELASRAGAGELGAHAARTLLARKQEPRLRTVLDGDDAPRAAAVVDALANSADGRALGMLARLLGDAERDPALRRLATAGMARTVGGAQRILELADRGALPEELRQAAAGALHGSSSPEIRQSAAKSFPLPVSKEDHPLPPLDQILKMPGDAQRGQGLFASTALCSTCHQVGGTGKEVGPALTEIGSKLSRVALVESILFPSAGISHNYETYAIELASGNLVNGILVSSTEREVVVKTQEAATMRFPRSDVAALVKLDVSLMPADLQRQMSAQDLVDVVEYLTTLRSPRPAD